MVSTGIHNFSEQVCVGSIKSSAEKVSEQHTEMFTSHVTFNKTAQY